jgi:hypothetical protein
MSESDLSNLIYSAMGMATSLFQFWLSASFALAMIAYFGVGKLTGLMFKIASAIYLLASFVLICGWFNFAIQISGYIKMMIQLGFETAHFDNIFGALHGVGVFSVFIVGTAGVLYYLHWTLRHQSDDT